MSALNRLLTRVAKRVVSTANNDQLMQIADRVVLWRNADYIDDASVDEIAGAMPQEAPETVETPEGAQGSTPAEDVPQDAPETPEESADAPEEGE